MSRGRRYEEPKLNMKKVFAVIVAIIVIIMCIVMLKGILSKDTEQGKIVSKDYFASYQNSKWGVIDSNGDNVIDPSYAEMIIVPNSKNDVFLCTYDVDYDNNTYKTKALNSENKEIFTEYDHVEAISNKDTDNNLWYENDVVRVEKNGLYGLIDLSGKELLQCEYDKIEALEGVQNTFKITKDGKVGIADNKGNVLITPSYAEITSLDKDKSQGFIVKSSDGKYGIVDTANKQVLETKYDAVEKIYRNDYYVVTENGKQEVVKKDGNIVLSGNYDKIEAILQNPENGIIYKQKEKYGIMNLSGAVVIKPEYEKLKEGASGSIIAKKDSKYGIIDLQGNQKVEFKYQNLSYNEKADLYIAEDDQYENEILDSNYQVKQTGYLIELNIDKGYMELNQNNSYKYYNFKFEEQNVENIFTSNTLFASKKDGKYGFVDKNGKTVVDYIYDDVTSQNSYGYAGIKKDGKWGAIDKDGKVVKEPTYNLDDYLKIDFIGGWYLGKDINMNYYRK